MGGMLLHLTKIDAAHYQLQTAIRMWFYGDDFVSAHTLAFAAYEIIHTVSKVRNPSRGDLLLDSSHVKPDKRKELNKVFREAANFFKHADRDPEGTIEFSPGLTELFIYFAIKGLDFSGVALAHELNIFMWWLQIRSPEAMMSKHAYEAIVKGGLIENLEIARAMCPYEFFEACMYGLTKSVAA